MSHRSELFFDDDGDDVWGKPLVKKGSDSDEDPLEEARFTDPIKLLSTEEKDQLQDALGGVVRIKREVEDETHDISLP